MCDIELEAHVPVDAGTGVRHQVAAQHVEDFAQQVSGPNQAQIPGRQAVERLVGLPFQGAALDAIDQLAQEQGQGRAAGAGASHDHGRTGECPFVPPGHKRHTSRPRRSIRPISAAIPSVGWARSKRSEHLSLAGRP